MATTFYPMHRGEPAAVVDVGDPGTGRLVLLFGATGAHCHGLTSAQAYRLARALIVAAGVAEHGDDYDADPDED